MGKLTDKVVAALEPRETTYYAKEDGQHGHGTLAVRVAPSGLKSWEYAWKREGQLHRVTLGQFPLTTSAAAHAAHAKMVARLARGLDPAPKPAPAAPAKPRGVTFKALCAQYMELHAKPKKAADSAAEDQRQIDRELLPVWGDRQAKSIQRREIMDLLDTKAKTAPVAANRLRSLVMKIMAFALDYEIIVTNPASRLPRPTKEIPRARSFSPREIAQFLARLPTAGLDPSTADALAFALYTGQRSAVVRTCEWAELDLPARTWTIPPRKMKNGDGLILHLPTLAIELLRRRCNNGSMYVFTGRGGKCAIADETLSQAAARTQVHFGLQQWTPHDLRRSMASTLASEGVQRLIIEKLLGHRDLTIAATYDTYAYAKEKREAMEVWGKVLELALETPPKVAQLHDPERDPKGSNTRA